MLYVCEEIRTWIEIAGESLGILKFENSLCLKSLRVDGESVDWLVGYVLWYINPCISYNAKSCLYIYTKYI